VSLRFPSPPASDPFTSRATVAASVLNVPLPGSFEPKHSALALQEYSSFVEADTSGTARAIASRYQPATCHVYKLAALWGYSSIVLLSVPDARSPFAPEIQFHAQAAGLPGGIWKPLVTPAPPEVPHVQALDETNQSMFKYLAQAHDGS
jgi:hypothetical protein